MTVKQAINILSSDTSFEAVKELQYYAGFDNDKVVEQIQEAMNMGAEALKKQIPKKPIGIITVDNEFICMICPSCQQVSVEFNDTYCAVCGQKLDWGD